MKRSILSFVCFVASFAAAAIAQDAAKAPQPREVQEIKREQPVSFGKEILPMLKRNCLACHHAKEPEGGLVLETHASLIKGGDSGVCVTPGKPLESLLFTLAAAVKEPVMPPDSNSVGAKPFNAAELGLLKLWIEQGAPGGDEPTAAPMQWQPLAANVQPIYALALSPDNQFAACGRGNQVSVYHLPTATLAGKLIDPNLPLLAGQSAPQAADLDVIQSIAFSPDGQRIATGGYRTVKIWKLNNTALANEQAQQLAAAGVISISPDGARLAVVNAENKIEIWNAPTRQLERTLQPPADKVTALAWSIDQARFASLDQANRITLWNLADNSIVAQVDAGGPLSSLTVASQGSLMIGIDGTKKLKAWALQTAQPAATAENPTPPAVTTLEPKAIEPWAALNDVVGVQWVTGEPLRVAIAVAEGKVHLADPTSGAISKTLDQGAPVQAIAVSPNGQWIASSGADGNVKIWAAASGEVKGTVAGDFRLDRQVLIAQRDHARQKGQVDRLTAQTANLEKAVQSENEAKQKIEAERTKAAEALAAKVKVRDEANAAMAQVEQDIQKAKDEIAQAQKMMEEATKRMETLAGQIDGKKKAIEAAEMERGKAEQEVTKHDQAIAAANEAIMRATAAVPAHQAIVTKATELATQLQQRIDQLQQQANTAKQTKTTALTFSRDNQRLIAATDAGAMRVYQAEGKSGYTTFEMPGTVANALHTTTDGLLLAHTGTATSVWQLLPAWSLERAIGTPEQSPFSDRVTALDFSQDGQSLYVGSGPPSRFGELKQFEVATGNLSKDFGEVHSDTILGVKQSPNGQYVATCAADKTIRLFRTDTGERIRSFEGHTHHVLAIAWQDDCQTLASASADATVKVWDVNTGEQRRTIAGFPKEVTAVAFVGQTSQVVTAAADAQARLHDVNNGQALRSFGGATDFLFAVAVSDDGQTVFAGGQDGVLRAWKVANAEAVHQFAPQ